MGEQAELAADEEDRQLAEDQLRDALREPPFCAWCGGTCECDDWSDDE
jgi:hypothetical protein